MKKLSLFALLLGIMLCSCMNENRSLIKKAIESNDLKLFQEQIDKCEDINADLNGDYSILASAIKENRPDFVAYLIEKGVDVSLEGGGKTPLMRACKSGSMPIVKLLVEAGADVNQKHKYKSPMYYSCKYQHYDIGEYIQSKGAEIDFIGNDGPYLYFEEDQWQLYRIKENELSIEDYPHLPKTVSVDFPEHPRTLIPILPIEEESNCVYDMPSNLFAISDIEGNYEKYYQSLLANHIIDEKLNWTFGDGHLVLLGDFVDRGEKVNEVLWLSYKLDCEAKKAGGKVHFILGNHELMNMQGKTRYADKRYFASALLAGKKIEDFYDSQSFLGKWLRSKNCMEKIGEHLFVHAGVSDSLIQQKMDILTINQIAKANIDTPKSSEEAKLIMNRYGPFWYRGLAMDYKYYKKASKEKVDQFTNYFSVDDIVIGHSIAEDICTDYNGKVIRIDVEHGEVDVAGILIEKNQIYKVDIEGNKSIL